MSTMKNSEFFCIFVTFIAV